MNNKSSGYGEYRFHGSNETYPDSYRVDNRLQPSNFSKEYEHDHTTSTHPGRSETVDEPGTPASRVESQQATSSPRRKNGQTRPLLFSAPKIGGGLIEKDPPLRLRIKKDTSKEETLYSDTKSAISPDAGSESLHEPTNPFYSILEIEQDEFSTDSLLEYEDSNSMQEITTIYEESSSFLENSSLADHFVSILGESSSFEDGSSPLYSKDSSVSEGLHSIDQDVSHIEDESSSLSASYNSEEVFFSEFESSPNSGGGAAGEEGFHLMQDGEESSSTMDGFASSEDYAYEEEESSPFHRLEYYENNTGSLEDSLLASEDQNHFDSSESLSSWREELAAYNDESSSSLKYEHCLATEESSSIVEEQDCCLDEDSSTCEKHECKDSFIPLNCQVELTDDESIEEEICQTPKECNRPRIQLPTVRQQVLVAKLQIGINIFHSFPFSSHNCEITKLEWLVKSLDCDVTLPSDIVFLKGMLIADIEYVNKENGNLQTMKLPVTWDETATVEWLYPPVMPIAKKHAEYMFKAESGEEEPVKHYESAQHFNEKIASKLRNINFVWHKKAELEIETPHLEIQGQAKIEIDLLQDQYLELNSIY
jgi:hypothetical protein